MLLTSMDEERCLTERDTNPAIERLKMKIKYLEKDNKDLQMDLDDVEATLHINKGIINSLVEAHADAVSNKKISKAEGMVNQETHKIIKKMERELQIASSRSQRLVSERDELKAQLLVAEQMSKNVQSKEAEITSHFQIEIQRLVEQVEKKEYTLQLLEQRLFD